MKIYTGEIEMVHHSRSFIGSQYLLNNWYFKHILITVNSNTKDFITNNYHLSSYQKIIGKAFNTVFYYFYTTHTYRHILYYQHGVCRLKNLNGS